MSSTVLGMEWYTSTLRAWHLAILRYAVTLDNADRLAVIRIAREIDRLEPRHDGGADFEFFRRTSEELCAAILQPGEGGSTVLQQYLVRIEDDRLGHCGDDRRQPADRLASQEADRTRK